MLLLKLLLLHQLLALFEFLLIPWAKHSLNVELQQPAQLCRLLRKYHIY